MPQVVLGSGRERKKLKQGPPKEVGGGLQSINTRTIDASRGQISLGALH